ncbi:hypothetical protein [Halalkalibacter oceani]|uniref:Uncharacterized protein n=1 Tax=Halalkalibacter oceani TaxID=1653776 RepID=A0A9X2DRS3_9BACI|nr:hypothetical protein [Halalkalibacter oceani]MCM3714960.1 hypothetical protein [Halalkalibacter oceani]
MNLAGLAFLSSTLFKITGIILIVLSLWELREGKNKKKYLVFMLTGLFLYLWLANALCC